MADLTPYEDRDVLQTTIRLTNAGDGLSQGLAIEPAEYHVGDVISLVIEASISRVAYEPIPDTDVLRRVHTAKTIIGTVVQPDTVVKLLDKAKRDVERARGVERLPIGDGDG